MLKICLKLVAVALLLVAACALLSPLFFARYEHHDYVGLCDSQNVDVQVDLVGSYAVRLNERGSPYYFRLAIKGDNQRELVASKLVSVSTGQELELTKIRRGVISGYYPGAHPKVWVSDDLVIPYEECSFVGSFASPEINRGAEVVTCSLVRFPKVEWRVPLKDALMSV